MKKTLDCQKDLSQTNLIRQLELQCLKEKVTPLFIPLMLGFMRKTLETKEGQLVYYTAPHEDNNNNRNDIHPSSSKAMHKYLLLSNSALTIDLFCFNRDISCHQSILWKDTWQGRNLVLQDISQGQERFPISVVNTVDKEEGPKILKYIKESILPDNVREKIHSGRSCSGCDCDNDCQDKLKCKCFIRTLNHYYPSLRRKVGDQKIGYDFKMLPFERWTMSGIFECNKNCKCKESCVNRVVQLGTKWWLQLFKTPSNKGWGVRTLTDIPAGSFVANYSGMIIREDKRKESSGGQWKRSEDWKYLINLEVETPMKNKRQQLLQQSPRPLIRKRRRKRFAPSTSAGNRRVSMFKKRRLFKQTCIEEYEDDKDEGSQALNWQKHRNSPDSGVHSMNGSQGSPLMSTDEPLTLSDEENRDINFSGVRRMISTEYVTGYERNGTVIKRTAPRKGLRPPTENPFWKYLPINESNDKEAALWKLGNRKYVGSEKVFISRCLSSSIPQVNAKVSLNKDIHPFPISVSSDADFDPRLSINLKTDSPFITGPLYCTLGGLPPKISPKIRASDVLKMKKLNLLIDNNFGRIKQRNEPAKEYDFTIAEECKNNDPSTLKVVSRNLRKKRYPVVKDQLNKVPLHLKEQVQSKSTSIPRRMPIRKKCRYSLRVGMIYKPYKLDTKLPKVRKIRPKIHSIPESNEYILDGREYGNIGRFFNHSCDPNMFPQYVFVDTHDLRFPWVSFFAKRDIRAGEEITWNYNYEPDNKSATPIIECKCLAENCTKRLC